MLTILNSRYWNTKVPPAADMRGRDITISTLDGGAMPAYVVEPEGQGPWPTAVVLGELSG